MGRWLEIFRATLKNEDRGRPSDGAISSHTGATPDLVGVPGVNDWPLPLPLPKLPGVLTPYLPNISGVADFSPVWPDMAPSGDGRNLLKVERSAITLARWILRENAREVHVRRMLREVRLPELRSAEQVKAAAGVLIDINWLRAPVIGFGAQSKVVYPVNPALWVPEAP